VPSRLRSNDPFLKSAGLWICGQHKCVAHKPTGPTAATDDLNDLEISGVNNARGPSAAALKATRHRRYYLFRRLYADSDSHPHARTPVMRR
jgi:hypothetical protein